MGELWVEIIESVELPRLIIERLVHALFHTPQSTKYWLFEHNEAVCSRLDIMTASDIVR